MTHYKNWRRKISDRKITHGHGKRLFAISGLCLTLIIVATLLLISSTWWKSEEELGGEVTKAINVNAIAFINCDNMKPAEGNALYISGKCYINVNIVNYENEPIIVHGFTLFYDVAGKSISIHLNDTVKPGESRSFEKDFELYEEVMVFDGSKILLIIFVHLEYSGKYFRIPAELYIAV